ncbi:MAG: hypothetical protein K2X77_15255 [Candidatus Obscuribacterales bacterium]|jgi:hypothetical protein|nr:hypothetical protein [Candidatus Obscuribacterales bacterium]
MRIQNIVLAIAVIAICPLSASAQAFGNLNINLNDVMVGQRMQDMSQQLSSVDASAFKAKKQRKHDKKNKNHRMALLHDANSQNTAADANQAVDENAIPATGVNPVPN